MNITSTQAKIMLTGNQVFSQLGFSMLMTRLKGLYRSDPSNETLQACTNEINAFLAKFQAIMGPDYAIISKI